MGCPNATAGVKNKNLWNNPEQPKLRPPSLITTVGVVALVVSILVGKLNPLDICDLATIKNSANLVVCSCGNAGHTSMCRDKCSQRTFSSESLAQTNCQVLGGEQVRSKLDKKKFSRFLTATPTPS